MPHPPSTDAALAGAELLLNLSASNITIGKAEMRRLLCASQAARCIAAYAYSAAGAGELTTDLAWDGQAGIFEIADLLAETERFSPDPQMAVADVDLGRIRQERMRTNTFGDSVRAGAADRTPFRTIAFDFAAPEEPLALRRAVERFPYVPSDPAMLRENCYEAYNIQVQGLAQRLRSTGLKKLVIGVSGGLDSTQALIVSARVMDRLGMPRDNVLAYTLPGFATSDATKGNAWRLMKALGVTGAEIDIRPAARQMLTDIGHASASGEAVYDVTYENIQAGLRTDYLFRLANHNGGLVVGTGDLSELGLGWCTYGVGDQMSHYNPNASVAKTLIQHLIRFVAASGDVGEETARRLARHPGDRDLARAGAARRRRPDPVDRKHCRALRIAGFQPVLHDPLRLPPVEDRLSFLERLEQPGPGPLAAEYPRHRQTGIFAAGDQAMAASVPISIFSVEPIQAVGIAQRPEDLLGGIAVAARRLASSVRRDRDGLARTARGRGPGPGVSRVNPGLHCARTPARRRCASLAAALLALGFPKDRGLCAASIAKRRSLRSIR